MSRDQVFNIYCDESSIEADKKRRFMVIGALIVPRRKKPDFLKQYQKVLSRHSFNEIKWVKVSEASLPVIKEIVDLFFQTDYANYYCIVVDKTKVDLKLHHNDDKELAFYKFYYILLKNKLRSNCKYYIYLDKKPVKVKNRVGVLKGFLTGFVESSRQDCVIKHLQEYSSSENKLIQISDLFTGAVASKFNYSEAEKSKSKRNLIKYIEKIRKKTLEKPSGYFEEKFNVFVWRPKK